MRYAFGNLVGFREAKVEVQACQGKHDKLTSEGRLYLRNKVNEKQFQPDTVPWL